MYQVKRPQNRYLRNFTCHPEFRGVLGRVHGRKSCVPKIPKSLLTTKSRSFKAKSSFKCSFFISLWEILTCHLKLRGVLGREDRGKPLVPANLFVLKQQVVDPRCLQPHIRAAVAIHLVRTHTRTKFQKKSDHNVQKCRTKMSKNSDKMSNKSDKNV